MNNFSFLKTRDGPARFRREFSTAQSARFIGKTFNGYRIDSLINVGGMAAVYKATRADGSFTRTAAIKIINPALLGDELQLRFLAERRILASITHPAIARLYDGGVTDEGLPYLIIEYVDGLHLDAYCRRHLPPLTERIRLFQRIAEAVQHAHERQIVHRDIKPSNIMVDAQGQPKLLDFGIAKIIDGSSGPQQSLDTPLTFRYASPEQITGAEITVMSDVFQLGGILHYLITGQSRHASDGAVTLMQAAVGDIVPPSRRLKQQLANPYRKDYRAVKGDLDAIVAKCLRLRPQERYASVELLLEDIERYREGLPVSARTEAWEYTFSRFLAKHRGLIITTFAFLMVLSSTVLYNTVQIHAAKVQAERGAEKAQRIKRLVTNIFRPPPLYEFRPRKISIGEILARAERHIDIELRGEPDIAMELYNTLAQLYIDLNDLKAAEAILKKSTDRLAGQWPAPIHITQARLLAILERYDEALELINAYLQHANRPGISRAELLAAYIVKARILVNTNRLGEARKLLLEGIDKTGWDGTVRHRIAQAHLLIAYSYTLSYNSHKIISHAEKAERLYQADHSEDHYALGYLYRLKGTAYLLKGELDKAERYLQKAIGILSLFPESSVSELASVYGQYQAVKRKTGDFEEALFYIEKAIALKKKYHDENSIKVTALYNNKANVLEEMGDLAAAIRLRKKVNENLKKSSHSLLPAAQYNLASSHLKLAHYDQALSYLNEAMTLKLVSDTAGDLFFSQLKVKAAEAMCALEKFSEAELYLNEAESGFKTAYRKDAPQFAELFMIRGRCRYYAGHYREAGALYANAQRIHRQLFGKNNSDVGLAALEIAKVGLRTGDLELAAMQIGQAKSIFTQKYYALHPFRIWTTLLGAELLVKQRQYPKARAQLEDTRALLERAQWHNPELNQYIETVEQQLAPPTTDTPQGGEDLIRLLSFHF